MQYKLAEFFVLILLTALFPYIVLYYYELKGRKMEYLKNRAVNKNTIQNYFKYIETIKQKISQSVYSFAKDSKNYDLDSQQSLHDAWLNFIKIYELSSGKRSENRKTEIVIELLGSYHDILISLTYSDVKTINMSSHKELSHGWGDLLVHEFRLDKDDIHIIHELEFQYGTIILSFKNFKCAYETI